MTTKLSSARVKANQKWDKENMTTISARVKREKAERYKVYAASQSKSLNSLIVELLDKEIEKKGDNNG